MEGTCCLKHIQAFMIFSTLGLALAGCGLTTSTQTEGGSVSSQNIIHLKIAWWGSQVRHDVTLKAIKLYEKEHPDETFTAEYSSYNDYWKTLATEESANAAPDIIQMDAAYLADYAARGRLADLSTGISTGDIDQPLLDSGKYKGKLYAVALGNNAYGIAYNKIALEKLGISLPRASWTWDAYFQLAKKIQPKLEQGHFAISDSSADARVYQTYQLAMGKGDIAAAKFAIDEHTWANWERTFAELRKEGVVPPPNVETSEKQYDPKQDLLLNGTVLFRPMFAAEFPAYNSIRPGIFALTTMPKGVQAGGYLKPSMFWAVNPRSKHIKEAKNFINWFIHDPKAAEILGTTRGIPVSNQVLDALRSNFTDADKEQLELIKKTAKDANPFASGPKGWGNFEEPDYKRITQQLEFGKASYDQVFQELEKKFYDDIQ
ncbi:ABC transporter substrate-binding protein [Fodinisporobacter ferrooxydans]|uniref:ABC transporter substrate-binding protein n=1 Tax=Fodinisporobacter ferrooxydans TaxID=2901836 RepID=A0ABY4CK01_9BACL|nr:ABC transporter substrate-binding protein [Alicyclobacillaceae bacterium MYW30-H2]